MQISQTNNNDVKNEAVAFLASFDLFKFVQSFVKKYQIKETKISDLLYLLEQIVSGEEKLAGLPTFLKVNFGVGQGEIKAAVELAGQALLPIEGAIVGGVTEQLQKWQGNSFVPSKTALLIKTKMTAEVLAKKVISKLGIVLSDPKTEERLENFLVSYIKKVRDHAT